MLDTAEVIEDKVLARGTRQLTINDPILLPDGALPQVYIIEAMAQISGIASGRDRPSVFAAIDDLVFHGTAQAGDTLQVESTVERNFGAISIFAARALVSGTIIAEGGLYLRFDEGV
jgi:3-hydroxymyristoyl/3-hydroxydecanoyl-(acyl carrier protein) dehydratase